MEQAFAPFRFMVYKGKISQATPDERDKYLHEIYS
jgi:hypothetical protein